MTMLDKLDPPALALLLLADRLLEEYDDPLHELLLLQLFDESA
jgi:hypothetical protein